MLKVKGVGKSGVINIRCNPVEDHISSLKYANNDWGTVAFIIPRKEVMEHFVDLELRYNCIYFLIGYNPMEQVYVGQAKKRNNGESVLARLREHIKNTTERYHNIWEYALCLQAGVIHGL